MNRRLGLVLGLLIIVSSGIVLICISASLTRDLFAVAQGQTTPQVITPRTSRVSIAPTPLCDRSWGALADAWIDENTNGVREDDEQPLQNVVYHVNDVTYGYKDVDYQVGNSRGRAELYVFLPGCPHVIFEICAESPVGYEPTTPACVRADSEEPRPQLQFGFRYSPGVTPTSQPRVPITCTSYTVEGTHLTSGASAISGIAFAPDGAAWVAAADGHVSRFALPNWYQTSYPLGEGQSYPPIVRAITVAPDGTVWASTDDGAARLDGSTWMQYEIGERLIRGAEDIAVVPDGLVWVTTSRDGIWTFDPKTDAWNTRAIDLEELGVEEFSAIEVAPDGSLWFFGSTDIWQLIEKPDGRPEWIAHKQGYASRIGEMKYLSTHAIAFDNRVLWIAGVSDEGPSVVRFDPITQMAITYNHHTTGGAMFGGRISSLATGPDGSVWIGLYENGALHFIPDTEDVRRGTWIRYTPDDDGLIRGAITSVAVGLDGAVWFGTDRGTVARCEVGRE